jgi:BCD family chlorophyll transporter-like MFS transporter
MQAAPPGRAGLALGIWGAVQATSAGIAIGLGGVMRDIVTHLAVAGQFGDALASPLTGYAVVFMIEVFLLFATAIAVGPLVRTYSVGGALPSPQP